MKNFNILGVHWRIQLLGGGGSRKTNIDGGLPKRGGLGQFANLMRGGLGKKEAGVFLRGRVMPQCTLWSSLPDSLKLQLKRKKCILSSFVEILAFLFLQ